MQCELCQYFQLFSSQCSRKLAPCQGRHMLQEKLYHSSSTSWEGDTNWKEAWLCPLDTHQLYHLKHDSGIFASAMLDPALMHCDFPSVFILPLGYEVISGLVTHASATWTN